MGEKSMLQHVGDAIVPAFPEWPGYDVEPIARRVLLAMYEPTEAMVLAGSPHAGGDGYSPNQGEAEAYSVWTAMMDEVLK